MESSVQGKSHNFYSGQKYSISSQDFSNNCFSYCPYNYCNRKLFSVKEICNFKVRFFSLEQSTHSIISKICFWTVREKSGIFSLRKH